MAEFPALPLFTDAFLADTAHLTDAEAGLYLRMLMQMWRLPGCRMPNDDAWLAKRFGRSDSDKLLRSLIVEFCQSDGNWITQKRLTREMKYVRQQSQRQSVRAKLRWDKEKEQYHGNAASGNTPTPTPLKKDSPHRPPKGGVMKANGHDGSRGTSLPRDWEPSAEDTRFARELGLDADAIAAEFRDYWCDIPGSRGRKLSWSGTYRNRCREIAGRAVQRSGPATGIAAGFAEALRRRKNADGG